MAENVFWLRLKVGMFDGESFKRIKRAKIGGVSYRDKLTSVWFELLDLAGKSNANGYLIDNNGNPYKSYEDIATMLDRDEKEIELCMGFYIGEKMVEIIDDAYILTNFVKYQNNEGLEKIRAQNRERQAKFREKKKRELLTAAKEDNVYDNVDGNVTSRYSESQTTECNANRVTDNVTSRKSSISNSISYSNSNSNMVDGGKYNNNINTTQAPACERITVEQFEHEIGCVGWEHYPNGDVYAKMRDTLIELINDGTVLLWEINYELLDEIERSMFNGLERRSINNLSAYIVSIISRKRKERRNAQ